MQLEDLVSRIRSGDKGAIRELVSLYGSAVYQRAFERLQDKELAREAARQTFGQFVSVVQRQTDDDGWSLWFGDLIERNIATYAQIGADMGYIEEELERELYGAEPPPVAIPARTPPRADERAYAYPQGARETEPGDYTVRSAGQPSVRKSVRDAEYFDRPPQAKRKRGASRFFGFVLLTLVCLVLLWVVAGVGMSMKWLPYYDLGYTWFNLHVFRLF